MPTYRPRALLPDDQPGPWSEPVAIAYTQRDVLLYAVGIGCSDLRHVYEQHPQFAVFPTFAIRWGAAGLKLQTRLNGVVVQEANTNDMIFDIATLIATISEVMTLEPGDVIATGTPSGIGMARNPPLWMRAGDVCEVEIEGIGVLRNTVAQS